MRRVIVGLVVALGCAVVVAGSWPSPAGAGGGSQLLPDREHYRPGDPVHLTADVYKLDRDWFGPYTVYVRPMDLTGSEPAVEVGRHPQDVAVGRLVVTRIDDQRVRAEVTFVLPKLADGPYQVDTCGPDCSKRLGDLYSSWLHVGTEPYVWPNQVPDAEVPPTTVAAPATTASSVRKAASTTTSSAATKAEPAAGQAGAVSWTDASGADDATGGEDGELGRWVVVGAVVAVAFLAATVVVRRGRRRRSITLGHSVDDGNDPAVEVVLDRERTLDEAIGGRR